MDKLESRATTGPAGTLGSNGAEPGVPLLQMRGITKSFFGVPVLGGRRYLKGYEVERYFRDAKVT